MRLAARPGLLTIVDHGDGYLSLYGHNDGSTRRPANRSPRANPLPPPATAVQQRPELYFEIRKAASRSTRAPGSRVAP